MCECGCSTMAKSYQFPGPNKSIYTLELYPGCVDCDCPPSVAVIHYKDKNALEIEHDLDILPKIDFIKETEGIKSFGTPIIDPREVIKQFVKLCGDFIDPSSIKDDLPFTVKEMLEDIEDKAAYECVTNAARDTINKKD